MKRVKKTRGCWLWTGYLLPSGYGVTARTIEGRKALAHRFSWEESHGRIPRGMCVCHRCDNPRCVRPSHLFLGTRSDNMKDCSKKGRLGGTWPKGEAHFKAKLNAIQVQKIRDLRGIHQQSTLGIMFGVTAKTIGRIQRKESWI